MAGEQGTANAAPGLEPASLAEASEKIEALRESLCSVIRGKREPVDLLIIAMMAGGAVLLEDVPGVGKTTLAKALARSIDAAFHRIQFTPDLLPADILGSSIYNPRDGAFDFRPGPIFANVLLADEINRASPRTQSALLEAMSEGQATTEGVGRPLPRPFLVLATQNPVEFQGTYPLPEAQLDRFLGQVRLGYPDAATEVDILYAIGQGHPVNALEPVLDGAGVLSLQACTASVRVERSVGEYLVALVGESRAEPRLQLGVSPRGSLLLFRASQANALCMGRDYVIPDDVQSMACFVLAHRLILTAKAKYTGTAKEDIVRDILGRVRVPS